MKYLLDILSLSKALPAGMAIIRFRKIHASYYPFIYTVWIGLLNESFSTFLFYYGKQVFGTSYTTINNGIYSLLEACLYAWQLKNWGAFRRQQKWFPWLIAGLITFWVVENLLFGHIMQNTSIFRVVYASLLVLMSLDCLNRLLLHEHGKLLKNPVFLILVCFIILFTYKAIVQVFWLYGLNESREFRRNVSWVFTWINALTNIIFTFAILWMPDKHRFSSPSLRPSS